MLHLWNELGLHSSSPQSDLIVELIDQSFHQFDYDQSGGLNFEEFLVLLRSEPWIQMIPEETQVTLTLIAVEASSIQ